MKCYYEEFNAAAWVDAAGRTNRGTTLRVCGAFATAHAAQTINIDTVDGYPQEYTTQVPIANTGFICLELGPNQTVSNLAGLAVLWAELAAAKLILTVSE